MDKITVGRLDKSTACYVNFPELDHCTGII